MVASDLQLDFFSLSWVQEILHPNWEMLCDDDGNYIMFIPLASKFGLTYRLQPLFIHNKKHESEKGLLSVNHALRKIDTPSILFFFGIFSINHIW